MLNKIHSIFMNVQTYSTPKDHNSLGIRSLGELSIDKC